MKNILAIFLITSASTLLVAGEIQYGKGDFTMGAGFMGMGAQMSTDITSYTMQEEHANFFGNGFYKYSLTWYDSKVMTDMQNLMPSTGYEFQGLDANIALGYDIVHKGKNDYIALGILAGISMPWIEGTDNTSGNPLFTNTKTSITIYKVGPTISLSKSVGDYLSIYGSATYAYQTGEFENDMFVNSSIKADGTFQEYVIGVKLQSNLEEYEFGWFTISPKLYLTAGYKFTKWEFEEMNMQMMGITMNSSSPDFYMDASTIYFGLGYGF